MAEFNMLVPRKSGHNLTDDRRAVTFNALYSKNLLMCASEFDQIDT